MLLKKELTPHFTIILLRFYYVDVLLKTVPFTVPAIESQLISPLKKSKALLNPAQSCIHLHTFPSRPIIDIRLFSWTLMNWTRSLKLGFNCLSPTKQKNYCCSLFKFYERIIWPYFTGPESRERTKGFLFRRYSKGRLHKLRFYR